MFFTDVVCWTETSPKVLGRCQRSARSAFSARRACSWACPCALLAKRSVTWTVSAAYLPLRLSSSSFRRLHSAWDDSILATDTWCWVWTSLISVWMCWFSVIKPSVLRRYSSTCRRRPSTSSLEQFIRASCCLSVVLIALSVSILCRIVFWIPSVRQTWDYRSCRLTSSWSLPATFFRSRPTSISLSTASR